MQGVLNLSLFPFDTSRPAPFGTNDRATSATHQCNVDLDGKTEGGRATHTHLQTYRWWSCFNLRWCSGNWVSSAFLCRTLAIRRSLFGLSLGPALLFCTIWLLLLFKRIVANKRREQAPSRPSPTLRPWASEVPNFLRGQLRWLQSAWWEQCWTWSSASLGQCWRCCSSMNLEGHCVATPTLFYLMVWVEVKPSWNFWHPLNGTISLDMFG